MISKKIKGMDYFRTAFLLVYVIFTALNKFLFFQAVPHTVISVIYAAIAAAGCVLILYDLFTERSLFRFKGNGLLILFMLLIVISSVVNVKYGYTDNIKSLVWMAIQIFFLSAVSHTRSADELKKEFSLVGKTFCFIWFIGTAWSIWQFLVRFADIHEFADGTVCEEGFLRGRLFGIYTDPNVGAVCSILTVILLCLFFKGSSRLFKIYSVVNIVLQLEYIILSYSRTAQIICMACILVAVFVLVKSNRRLQSIAAWKSISAACLAAVFLAVSVLPVFYVARKGLALLPEGVYAVEKSLGISNDNAHKAEQLDSVVDISRPDIDNNNDISNNRFKIWGGYLKVSTKTPVFGTSPRNFLAAAREYFGDNYYVVTKNYSIHNGYLAVLVCLGIPGAVCIGAWMILLVVTVLGYLFRNLAKPGEYFRFTMHLILILVTIAISSFFMMGFFFCNSVIEFWFWYALGFLLCLLRKSEPERYSKEPVAYRISQKLFDKIKGKKA